MHFFFFPECKAGKKKKKRERIMYIWLTVKQWIRV